MFKSWKPDNKETMMWLYWRSEAPNGAFGSRIAPALGWEITAFLGVIS